VFRAYDAAGEQLVAVKLFKLDLPPERGHQLVAEFERLIAADLTHPALASPLATGIYDVTPYLVQEYVAAESLDLAVREYGPAPAADAVRVAAQLAGALDFTAAVNVTHGALHPRDVLLSSDETRLTGIGVARALERVGVAAPVRRPYSAPERVGGREWDRRADVFSLAALMHELIWARRVSGIGDSAVENLTEIPGADMTALRALFARALAEDPARRYDTALEFAQALKDAFPDVESAAVRAPAPKRRSARQAAAPSLPLLDASSREGSEPSDADIPPAETTQTLRAETATASPADPDLTLTVAPEEVRYRDVEVPLAVVEAATLPLAEESDSDASTIRQAPDLGRAQPQFEPLVVSPPSPETFTREPEPLSALERSRSATWPLALALVVGLTIGFAGGYGTGMRERPAPTVPAAAPAATPAGREFTESAVTTAAPKAAAPSATPKAAAPPAKAPAPPKRAEVRSTKATSEGSGRLLVRSTPAGARVFVDGKDQGRTPAVVRDLAHGTHRVRLTHDGYSTEERGVVITTSRPSASLTIPLQRTGNVAPVRTPAATPASASRFSGDLTVISRPAGATVFLDNKIVGTTPLSMPGVAAGSHAIRLERDGYRRWSSAISVV
jgi:hypothetical protein